MSASIFGDTGVSSGQISDWLIRSVPPASFGIMADGTVGGGIAIPAVNLLYIYPFPVPGMIVTSIFQRLQTVGAGSSVKCAVWANNPDTGRPTGLPLFGQNAGFDTSANTGIKSAAIANYALPAGMYWFGSKATGTLPQMTYISQFNSAAMASRMAFSSAAEAMPLPASMPVAFSVPDAFANDIMALNLTGATFTPVNAAGVPAIGLGWA